MLIIGREIPYTVFVALVIRNARPEDAEALCVAHRLAILETARGFYTETQLIAWVAGVTIEAHRRQSRSPDFFVAELDGLIVGFGALDVSEHRLSLLYVHPNYSRRGIGRALSQTIEQRARDKGIKELRLESSLNAAQFYLSVGYQKSAKIIRTLNGIDFDCVAMRKSLEASEDLGD